MNCQYMFCTFRTINMKTGITQNFLNYIDHYEITSIIFSYVYPEITKTKSICSRVKSPK